MSGLSLFTLTALSVCAAVAPEMAQAQASAFQAGSFTASDGLTLPYRIFIPKNRDPKKSYPLVLAMHGAGERGTDNMLQLTTHQLATVWARDSNQARYPSFVLAPQCPPYPAVWVDTPFGQGTYDFDKAAITPPMKAAVALLDSIVKRYDIDTNRIYVAGLSMGGYATWALLTRYPKRFAAAIPICGGGDTSKAPLFKHVPLWVFHGDSDHTVPVAASRQMVAALRKAGGTPVYTEYKGVDHGSWGPALMEPELAGWLFAQKRSATTAIRSATPRPNSGRAVGRFTVGTGTVPSAPGVDGLGRTRSAGRVTLFPFSGRESPSARMSKITHAAGPDSSGIGTHYE
jgi:predicted peptidase